jgi:hypothetical protein
VLSFEVEEDGSIIFPLRISKAAASDERHAVTLFFDSDEEKSHYSSSSLVSNY